MFKYLKTLPETVSDVTLYSDTCGGQNRKKYVATLLLYAVQSTHIKVIHQKFLESGHTEMQVDSMHSAIEREKKCSPVFTALDWHAIFRRARRHNQYEVVPMTHTDFIDLKKLSNTVLKNMRVASIQWMRVKCLMFSKNTPDVIYFRYNPITLVYTRS